MVNGYWQCHYYPVGEYWNCIRKVKEYWCTANILEEKLPKVLGCPNVSIHSTNQRDFLFITCICGISIIFMNKVIHKQTHLISNTIFQLSSWSVWPSTIPLLSTPLQYVLLILLFSFLSRSAPHIASTHSSKKKMLWY